MKATHNSETVCNYVHDNPLIQQNYDDASFNNMRNHEVNDDILLIFVYQPSIRIKHIRLNPKSLLMIFNKIYPEDSIYIYRGEILDKKKTFQFYEMRNDNVIVCLSSKLFEGKQQIVDKWLSITNNKEDFEERMKSSINQSNRNELSRLRDLKNMKCEMKKKKFGSIHKSLVMKTENNIFSYKNNSKHDQINLNIDFKQELSPLNDPLPIIW